MVLGDFNIVIKNYKGMIYSILKKYHIHREIDDYEQICFIALWEAHCNFDPEKGQFSTFAYAKMNGAVLHQLRKSGKYYERHCYFEPILLEVIDNNSTDLSLAEWDLFIDSIQLTPLEKNILLQKSNGLTFKQISVKHELSIDQVKKRYYKILEILRNYFNKD